MANKQFSGQSQEEFDRALIIRDVSSVLNKFFLVTPTGTYTLIDGRLAHIEHSRNYEEAVSAAMEKLKADVLSDANGEYNFQIINARRRDRR